MLASSFHGENGSDDEDDDYKMLIIIPWMMIIIPRCFPSKPMKEAHGWCKILQNPNKSQMLNVFSSTVYAAKFFFPLFLKTENNYKNTAIIRCHSLEEAPCN